MQLSIMVIDDSVILAEVRESFHTVGHGQTDKFYATVVVISDVFEVRKEISNELLSFNPHLNLIQEGDYTRVGEVLRRRKPDILVFDVVESEPESFGVAVGLKESEEFKEIPIIFITSNKNKSRERVAKEANIDYVEKPFTPKEIYEKLSKDIKH